MGGAILLSSMSSMAPRVTATVFDWKNPDYGPVYTERAERLKRIREPGYDLDALKAHYAEYPGDFRRSTEKGLRSRPPP